MTEASHPGSAAAAASSAARTASPASSSRFRSRDPGQHVRGVGPLPHPGRHQPGLFQPRQQQVQRRPSRALFQQPGPEQAQHREIEPAVGQVQAQAVLPVDPAPGPRPRPAGRSGSP